MLLSIDTCGSLGTVALVRMEHDEPVVLGQTELAGKTYAAQLVPAVRDLLLVHNVGPSQVVTIVVTKGPGSFTGIRIGLSTAKGLAEIGSIPIVAVSRLAVLAYTGRTNAAALDASRGEFYLGDFSSAPTERLLTREVFLDRAALLAEDLAVCEDPVHAAAPESIRVGPPTAADALRFAIPRLRARDFDDPVTLDGNYLRRSDAEIFAKPKLAATP